MTIYPRPLEKGSTIAITGPSGGVEPALHKRLDLAIKNLHDKGYKVIEGECLRNEHKHVSSKKEQRAKDFMNLYSNDDIDAIFPPWGGVYLIEILPLLDWKKLSSSRAKWVIGFSDTSTLMFALAVKLNTASIHSINLMDSLPSQKDELSLGLFQAWGLKKGDSFTQSSSEKWQKEWKDVVKDGYNLTETTEWKNLKAPDEPLEFSGKLIGGCLDTLSTLVGTEYEEIRKFKEKNSADGTILYLENCDLCPYDVVRYLTQMRLSGWFDDLKGVVFGRSHGKDSTDQDDTSYQEALLQVFSDIDVPVIWDADIGHCVPQLNIINGALGTFILENKKGELIQNLFDFRSLYWYQLNQHR